MEATGCLLDVEGAARRLGVSIRHVRYLVQRHRIPVVRWGRLLRFDPADLDAWIDAHRHQPVACCRGGQVPLIGTSGTAEEDVADDLVQAPFARSVPGPASAPEPSDGDMAALQIPDDVEGSR